MSTDLALFAHFKAELTGQLKNIGSQINKEQTWKQLFYKTFSQTI